MPDLEIRIGELLVAIAAAREENAILRFDLAGGAGKWAIAIDTLMIRGDFASALYVARQMAAAFPNLPFPRNMCHVIEHMPPVSADYLPFSDNPQSDVQVVKRPGADTVIIVFGDNGDRAIVQFAAIHRWLGLLPASIIYLRDLRHLYYLDGLPSLGLGWQAAIDNLKVILDSMGVTRILCFANSGGVYGALHYGSALGAEAALCVAPRIDLGNRDAATMAGKNFREHPLSQNPPDLRELLLASGSPPHIYVLAGENVWIDRLHADALAGVPGVHRELLIGYGRHNTGAEIIRLGLLPELLDWLLHPDTPPPHRPGVTANAADVPALPRTNPAGGGQASSR